jgi:hypothetical protein
MGTPTDAMFEQNYELYRILNCGAAEIQLPKLRELKQSLDFFHETSSAA